MTGMSGWMPQRPPPRPQMGPSPMTAGRPNPMAGFQGGGFQGRPPGMMPPGAYQGAQGVEPNYGGAQPMAPWMPPSPPQMPPGGGGVHVAQGQPPPGGWGGPGYSPPGPQQAAPLLQAPMGMGGRFVSEGGPSDPTQQRFGGGFQGTPPWMGGDGGPPGALLQGGMGSPVGVGPMGGPQVANLRQRRFPGALGRGIMQAMAPPPQAAPPAPYGGQQFRMW